MTQHLGVNTIKGRKTMLGSGENYDFFYICFFLDILKLYLSFQIVLND
jgi:hypothetical protein